MNKLCASDKTEIPLTGDHATGSFHSLSLTPSALCVQAFSFLPRPTFLQFVQNGLDLNFMVAIDFTGSNGNPYQPSSLHYANPAMFAQGQFNQYSPILSLTRRYERAIAMIGNVIEFYDTDRMFPVYGFGACMPGSTTANHCFALNFNETNPEVPGVAGVMDVYHSVLTRVQLSGPTLFAPVLSKAAR